MPELLDSEAYLPRLLAAPRPGSDKMLVFYDHRVGAFCRDPRLLLIPMDDHMVHRGDGLFEALKFVGRRLYQLDAHLKRMQGCAKAIKLTPPCSWERLRELCLEICAATDQPDGMLRIFLGRGPGGFGIDPAETAFSTLYLVVYKLSLKPEEVFAKGVTACRSEIPAKQSYMARVKSTNYLPNALMRLEAAEKGCDFTLTYDAQGFLAESSTENVCLVDQNGVLMVPDLSNSLTGTTLMRGLDLIKDEVRVQFKHIREDELYHAREIMLVGTTIDSLSVVRYNGKPIHDVRPGPVSRRMRELLMQDLADSGIPL